MAEVFGKSDIGRLILRIVLWTKPIDYLIRGRFAVVLPAPVGPWIFFCRAWKGTATNFRFSPKMICLENESRPKTHFRNHYKCNSLRNGSDGWEWCR